MLEKTRFKGGEREYRRRPAQHSDLGFAANDTSNEGVAMTQPPDSPQQWWQPPVTGAPAPIQWQSNGGQQPQAHTAEQWQQAPQQAPYPQQYGGSPPPAPPSQPGQGQYRGGFQPSHYSGLGAFGEQSQSQAQDSKRRWYIVGISALVIATGGAAAWLLGVFSGDTLDQNSVQDGVTQVLKNSYGESDTQNAQCPTGQEIKTGNTFDCTVKIAGQQKRVTIRILNDKPEYEVGAPH
jgi:hypothetical protein